MSDSVYQILLGDSFQTLKPVLRNFHSHTISNQAEGSVSIQHGKTFVVRLIAKILALPQIANDCPVKLDVRYTDGEETWSRTFNKVKAVSRQIAQDGLLREFAGPASFAFKIENHQGNLHFNSKKFWLFGIPIPSLIAPQIKASEIANEHDWQTTVEVSVKLFGRILFYTGKIKPV